MRDTGERMKGGAVSDDRSPENEAMLKRKMSRWRYKKNEQRHAI